MGSLRQLYWQQRIEQRQLTAAAKIIQNAYRQYRRRTQSQQKQLQLEYKAAVIIQTYYRRYKQYCYSKKLHQAAALIQRQFRLYKSSIRRNGAGPIGNEFHDDTDSTAQQRPLIEAFAEFLKNKAKQEALAMENETEGENGECSVSYTSANEYFDERRQKAAILIQHAFRCHRKRHLEIARDNGLTRKRQRISDDTGLSEIRSACSDALQQHVS